MRTVVVGAIGLGKRGFSMLRDNLFQMDGVEVRWVCDLYEDRCEKTVEKALELGRVRPKTTTDYHDILNDPEVEAVFNFTAWESHVPVCVDAMKAGKQVALEVGGAYSVDDCWRLVRTYEETKTPFMFLENCCYGEKETMVLNMVRKGLFGTVVHCKGGYCHDLRDEVATGKENRHYRLQNYLNRNCENYPTHELGPIAKVLDINRGNRMLSLVSVASKSQGLHDYVNANDLPNKDLKEAKFAQGDIINTVITCAHGETILLTLDTTLPRCYCRDFTVRGTKAMYSEESDMIIMDGQEFDEFFIKNNWGNASKYEEHLTEVWKKYKKEGIKGGHGGIDWLELEAFIDCVREKKPMPIDVYDAASWMCITPLSEDSIATGQPVAIPDFTSGRWTTRPPMDVLK